MIFATDAADIHPPTWVGNVTSLENGYTPSVTGGVPTILTLNSANGVGFIVDSNSAYKLILFLLYRFVDFFIYT